MLAGELQRAPREELQLDLVRPVRPPVQVAYPNLSWHYEQQIVQVAGRTWLYQAHSLSFVQRLFLQQKRVARGHRLERLVPPLHSSCWTRAISTALRRLKGHGERERFQDWRSSKGVTTCIGKRKQTFVVLECTPYRYVLRSSRRIRERGAEALGTQNSASVAGKSNLQNALKKHS